MAVHSAAHQWVAAFCVVATWPGAMALAADATSVGEGPAAASSAPSPGDAAPSVQQPPEPEEPQAPVTPSDMPSLQMAPDFTSPALAFGGYFPLPDIEGGVVRYAPFNVRARMSAGMGFNDNVTLSNTNKRSSFLTTLSPAVIVGLERPDQRYYFIYRGVYSLYASDSDSNTLTHSIGLQATNEWTERWRSTLRYEFLRGSDPRGSTDSAAARSLSWNVHSLRATVSYGAADARGRLDGNVGYTNRQYITDRATNFVFDYEQYDVGGVFSVRVAPKTRATLQAVHTEITHPNDPLSDSSENRYLAGFAWDATAKTQARIAVGYMTKDFDNGITSSFSAPSYEGSVSWAPRTYSVFSATARRSFAESNEAGSRFLVIDYVVGSWTHAWFERLRSTVGLVYGRQFNEGGISRTETYNTLDAKLSYALHPRLRLGAQFRRDTRTSPDPASEYTRNISLITLETAL